MSWVEDKAREMCGCKPCGGTSSFYRLGCARDHFARGIRAGLEKAADVAAESMENSDGLADAYGRIRSLASTRGGER